MDSAQTPASKGKILVVDDAPDVVKLLSEFLGGSGYEVCGVDRSSQVLSVALAHKPELILLDAHMPKPDGYAVCQQLKQTSELRQIPVIFMSVSEEKWDKVNAFAVGGADYITKPIWFEELLARVNSHLTTYRLQKRLQLQTQRALTASGQSPLLADLQRMLHRQTEILKRQNERLQQEIYEREQAEQALLQEKQKSEQLLLNILPRAIVEQLKQFEGSLAERFDEATILFADIVNFTPLAANVVPLELVNLLNQVFSAFDRLVDQYGLEKIKTIGDAYMVAGGLPIPQADHPEVVMEMAIAMQEVIASFTRDNEEPLQLRIGINTGAVVAGVIGIRKFSYDLWGDAVNIASRMEAQGVPGKIQVTEQTYQKLKHKYEFEPGGEIQVKGRGLMPIYHFVQRKS
ncbi:adenylate/guanylate cyclase domain-containing protein [Almyronema epifaneia]|uniref:Adenylate/guanylate cyclase domain-containing protein n=1 Tax=Almyronema epifaneia S1 TaxID=2991925 RepID=A0ABW6IIK1_9CYAN